MICYWCALEFGEAAPALAKITRNGETKYACLVCALDTVRYGSPDERVELFAQSEPTAAQAVSVLIDAVADAQHAWTESNYGAESTVTA